MDSCGSEQGTATGEWRGFVNTVKELLAHIRGAGTYHDYVSN